MKRIVMVIGGVETLEYFSALCQVLGWDSLNPAPSLRLKAFLCLDLKRLFLGMPNKPSSASLKKLISYH